MRDAKDQSRAHNFNFFLQLEKFMDNRLWQTNPSATPPSAPISPDSGYPSEGNPGTGTPATKIDAYWAHALGEEIRNAIEAGGLTPDYETLDQLATSISNQISARLHSPVDHVYSAAGTFSLAVPAWAKSARGRAWGGGAGALLVSGGEGAGGSGAGFRWIALDVSGGGSIDITIGAGALGHAADSDGDDGEDTIVSYGATTITAGGAQGGRYVSGAANPGNPGAGDVSGQKGGNPWAGKLMCEGGSSPFGGSGGLVTNGSSDGRWPGGGGAIGYTLTGNVAGDGADGGVEITFYSF